MSRDSTMATTSTTRQQLIEAIAAESKARLSSRPEAWTWTDGDVIADTAIDIVLAYAGRELLALAKQGNWTDDPDEAFVVGASHLVEFLGDGDWREATP